MTDLQFYQLFTEALIYDDLDAYLTDYALSSMWEDGESDDIPPERIERLSALWTAAHLTVRNIRQHTGLSQAAFAQRFCIPRRTVEDWESGRNGCAPYLRLLLAQAVGLYQRP